MISSQINLENPDFHSHSSAIWLVCGCLTDQLATRERRERERERDKKIRYFANGFWCDFAQVIGLRADSYKIKLLLSSENEPTKEAN